MEPPKKTPNCVFFCYQVAQTPFCFVRVKSHYKNEVISGLVPPPISMDTMFSRCLVHFSFSVKDKKKSAEGAEDAEAPQALGGSGGLIFMGQELT